MNPWTRLDFAKTAAAGVAALSQTRILGANERVRLGFIGVGNRESRHCIHGTLRAGSAGKVAMGHARG